MRLTRTELNNCYFFINFHTNDERMTRTELNNCYFSQQNFKSMTTKLSADLITRI